MSACVILVDFGMSAACPVLGQFRKCRNLIERFFNKIKQSRRIATRYDKLAANCLAFINLASICIWLERDDFRMNRRRAPACCLSMILSENRHPHFQILV
jgi:hypothetical protein